MMLTCESQTPGDRQLFRWKERRSRSNIRSLRPGIAPPGKLRLTNVQSNTNNDNNNNPTEIVTNHWCGRELIWDLNSLAKSVLIDDEHIKALAVSRLPRIDDVSPHLLQRFVARILFKVHHVFTIKKVLTLQARSFCSPKPNLFVTSTSFTEVSKEPEWKILPLIREAPWIEDDWVGEAAGERKCKVMRLRLPESVGQEQYSGDSQAQSHRNLRRPHMVPLAEMH